ncbi:MAG: hypothetical protein ACPIOQ_64360, partial [Promethearchaeia archaeon]
MVGTHTPRAASIIGANTPGCIVKRSVCAHCRVHGHDEFECPLLFAKVHGKRMPGHMMDGRKDAAGWDGECITRETAIEWLRMQQHGYFFKSWSEHETGEKVERAEGGETPAVRASTCDSGDEDDCIITRVEVEQDATAGAGFVRGRGQPDEPHCEHRSGDNDQPASWVCHHTDKWLCFEEGVRNRDRGFWSGLELDRIKASITYWRAKDPVVFHVCPRLPGCMRAWHVLVQDARMRWHASKCSFISRANGSVRTQALSEAEARPRLDEKVAKDIHLSVSVLRQRQAAHAQVLGSPCLRRVPGTLALLLAKMRWVIDVRCIPAGRRQQRGVRVLQKGPTKTSVAWQFLRVQKLEREREQK